MSPSLILPTLVITFLSQSTAGVDGQSSLPEKKKVPHVLFIVADDLGYNDVGYHQNQVSSANPHGRPTTNAAAGIMETPIMDQLASEGVKLDNYYVQPLCSPTRSSIMTGRYPSHTGIGPNVDRIDWPYGVPANEVFFPEVLRDYHNFSTHMVGKWHLGTCDKRYTPTFRGFDTYIGYLSGAQGYYNQAGDRNGSKANELATCLGPTYSNNYSSVFFAEESIRLIHEHDDSSSKPFFLFLAFQSVHNPYDEPPMDVNKTFPRIVDYTRRIYAGMIKMLDDAVGRVVDALKAKNMWDDTVLIFTTDNGGIGPGSNYPLRGAKVLNWEGGIKAVGFVRGTNNNKLRPIRPGRTSKHLMHATDWFLTIVNGIAGGVYSSDKSGQPLDGFNQWGVLAGIDRNTARTTIFHQVPVGARPIPAGMTKDGKQIYTTNMCMHNVDNRTTPYCSPFGVTGGAMRLGDYKLLITHSEIPPPWGDSSMAGIPQILPGGRYKNNTPVFLPETHDKVPRPYKGKYYLFNINEDPTETHNLCDSMPEKLREMLQVYTDYAESAKPRIMNRTTKSGKLILNLFGPHRGKYSLSWRWGFSDPSRGHNPSDGASNVDLGGFLDTLHASIVDIAMADGAGEEDISVETPPDTEATTTCTGPFLGSLYCAFGHEWECYVLRSGLEGHDLVDHNNITNGANTTAKCQAACAAVHNCRYWVLVDNEVCKLKSARGKIVSCDDCVFGPKACPS